MGLATRAARVFFLSFLFFSSAYGQITLNLQVTPSVCGYGNGVIYAKVSGGTPPYQFSDNGGPTQSSPLFSGLTAGTHKITVVDAKGASAGATEMLTNTFAPPSIVLKGKTAPTDCNATDGRVTVGASGGTLPYTYTVNGVDPQASPVFNGLSPGYYSVTVTDENFCKQSVNVVLTAPCQSAGAMLSYSPTVCAASGFLTATPAAGAILPYTYSLTGTGYPATPFQPSGSFINLPSGSYHLTVRDNGGHTAVYAFEIRQYCGLPATTATAPAHCTNSDGTITVTVTGGNPPIFYSADGKNYQESDVLTGQPAGKHTVYIIDAFLNTDTLTTTVDKVNDGLSVDAGAAAPFCAGGSVRLNGSSSSPDALIRWSPAAGLSTVNSLTPEASPATTTTYTLSATLGDCTLADTVTVVVNPLPVADAGSDVQTCYEQSVTLQGKGGTAYSWTPATYLDNPSAAHPTVVQPEHPVTYQLAVTDGNGCHSASPSAVSVDVVPKAVVFAGTDTSILTGQSITLHAQDVNNSGFTHYSWTPATGLSDPNAQDPVFNTDQEETYTVTAATDSGCSATDAVRIVVFKEADLFVPNAFTPNGDGHNDELHIRPVGMRDFGYFAVYNRMGQQVFLSRNATIGWDGRADGQPQPAGTYVWMANGVDLNGRPMQRNGTVMLIR